MQYVGVGSNMSMLRGIHEGQTTMVNRLSSHCQYTIQMSPQKPKSISYTRRQPWLSTIAGTSAALSTLQRRRLKPSLPGEQPGEAGRRPSIMCQVCDSANNRSRRPELAHTRRDENRTRAIFDRCIDIGDMHLSVTQWALKAMSEKFRRRT